MGPAKLSGKRKWLGVTGIVVGLAAVSVWYFDYRANNLLAEAQATLPFNPARTELLLKSSPMTFKWKSDAVILLCRALGRQGKWQEAETLFGSRQRDAREHAWVEALATEAWAQREYGFSEKVLTSLLQSNPDRKRTLRLLINAHFALGKHDQVTDECDRLLRLDPTDLEPLRVKAAVYERQSDLLNAVDAYKKLLAQAPADAGSIRETVVGHLIEVGDFSQARSHLALLLPSTEPSIRLLNARLEYFEGNHDAALATVTEILAQAPELVDARLLRATLLIGKDQIEPAVEEYQQVLQRSPFNQTAHYELGLAHSKLNQTELAEKHIAESRRIFQINQSIARLERELDRSPDNQLLKQQLAELYNQVGMGEPGPTPK